MYKVITSRNRFIFVFHFGQLVQNQKKTQGKVKIEDMNEACGICWTITMGLRLTVSEYTLPKGIQIQITYA